MPIKWFDPKPRGIIEDPERRQPWWQIFLKPFQEALESPVTSPYMQDFMKTLSLPEQMLSKPYAAAVTAPSRGQYTFESAPSEYLPGGQQFEAYEKQEMPWGVKGALEELPLIPAYLVGVGGVAKATESLTTQIMQRVESGLAKIAKKQIPTKIERAAMQSFRTAATGQEVSEEALLREAYGLVRASITEQLPQRVAQFGGEISKRALIKHLPNIVQKELGQLGYTIDDMAKMSLKDAQQLAASRQTKTAVKIENVAKNPIKLPPGQQRKVAAVEQAAEEAKLAAVLPLEEQPAIRKLVDFTYSLKKARLETERLYTEARKAQAAQLRAIAKAKEGGEAYVPSLKALSGKLPKGEAELPTPFTAKELKQFKDVIYTTRQLPPIEQDAFIRTHLSHTLMEMIEKRTIPGAKDIEYLELVFGKGLGKAFRDLRSLPLKIYDAFLEVMNIPRAIKASWDLSSLYRQGALVLTDRPQQIPAAFKAQVKAVFSDKWAKQVHDATHMTDWEGVMQRSKLFRPDFWGEATRLSTREEAFISRFLRASIPTGIKGVRIPVAPGVKRSERAYIVGLNKVRTDYFIYLSEQAQKMGVKLTDAEYNRIAGAVNIMTGRGEAAALNETLTALSGIFFSPRFQLSRIMTPTLLWSRSPVVRKMAARSLMKFFGFWTAVMGGIKLMNDPNVTAEWWDYRSTDTGKIRVGNTRIAPLAGFDSWMRFASRLITGKIKTQTGRVQDIDLGRLIWNYARSKFAPGLGMAIDWQAGTTYTGEKFEDMSNFEQFEEYLMPLAISATLEAAEEEGFVPGVALALPEFIGMGVNTYDSSINLVQELRTERSSYLEAKKKLDKMQLEGEDPEKIVKHMEKHPELEYGEFIGDALTAIGKLERVRKVIKEDQSLSDEQKDEYIDGINQQIVDVCLDVNEALEQGRGSRPSPIPSAPTKIRETRKLR